MSNSGPPLAFTSTPDGKVIIDGWEVVESDGRFTAIAIDPPTEIERQYGCLGALLAGSSTEMLTLICAQLIMRDQIARAQAEGTAI